MRIAKLHMDPQDKQRFEILGKSSVKYHLKANHVVEAKRWYWALNNAIQWAKDEARQEEKQKIKNTEQLQQAKIDQAERTSQRDKSDSAGESASISSARQGNRNGKGLTSSSNLGPVVSRVVAAGSSIGPASITDEDNGTAYDSYEPSVHRVASNIGTTTVEGDADGEEEYGDDVSSREVQPASKDAFNITAQSAKLQLDLLADISSALHAERTRNPSMAISNAVVVSAMRSYESAVESLKCLVGDLLKISRDRDAYWQYRLDCEADVRRLWEDSMARVVKEQEALEGKIGESEDKRKRTKRALRDVLEGGSRVTFDSRPTSRGAEDHEQVVDALEKVMLDQSGAALQSPSTGLSRRKSRVEHIIDISDSEDEGDDEFFDAIEAGEVEVISEMPTSPPPEIIKEVESTLGIRELKKAEIELSFVGYEDGPRERLKLDADNRPKISLWVSEPPPYQGMKTNIPLGNPEIYDWQRHDEDDPTRVLQ
jgi:oxysterol-binding protein 1